MVRDTATEELLRSYRRDLHRIPEVDFDLPKTLSYVQGVLESLVSPVKVFSPCRSTLCAFFDRGTESTYAIRADMDALPVTERTGAYYASTHEGKMHACGHDGHMAMVLGLAHWLDENPDVATRNVLLVFQPAEETTGGARLVCESGVFEQHGVDRIFGFHLWPDLPEGVVVSRPGALLASSNETTVTFLGKASHIAKASEGNDALEAACTFLASAYRYADERSEEEPFLLKFGRAEAGQVRNQIAARACLEGSLRTFSVAMGARARADIEKIAARCATDFGCTSEVVYSYGYPPVVNDAGLLAQVRKAVPEVEDLPEPLLISEDFSFYQERLPGVFMLLGTGTGIPLHADTFDFDEGILARGLDVYKRLVRMP